MDSMQQPLLSHPCCEGRVGCGDLPPLPLAWQAEADARRRACQHSPGGTYAQLHLRMVGEGQVVGAEQ